MASGFIGNEVPRKGLRVRIPCLPLGSAANWSCWVSGAAGFKEDEIPANKNVSDNKASEFYKRKVTWIQDFDSSLDESHEVRIHLVTFGQTVMAQSDRFLNETC